MKEPKITITELSLGLAEAINEDPFSKKGNIDLTFSEKEGKYILAALKTQENIISDFKTMYEKNYPDHQYIAKGYEKILKFYKKLSVDLTNILY